MLFSELAFYFKKLEETASRNAMTEILAQLFHKSSVDEIGKICYLLQGRVVPLYDAIEFGISDKFMVRAVARAGGVAPHKVSKILKQTGDIGITAQNCFHAPKHGNRQAISVADVYNNLHAIATMSGEGSQEKKITALADLFTSADQLSARYIARVPLDKLRLGFSDMTILDALSWMLAGDKTLRAKLEDAYNVQPDIGEIAKIVKSKGIKGLVNIKVRLGAPILASLCQRLPTADEMIVKMGRVAAEPKFDGVRVQIHFRRPFARAQGQHNSDSQTSEIKTFSRNLENTTEMFPELEDIGSQVNASEAILDSEAVGIDPKTGKIVSFQETTTRKRKHNIEEARKNVPLKFFVFDILYKDGRVLLSVPLSERRAILEKSIRPGNILIVSPQIVTDLPMKLRAYHDEQLKKGLEGAVVKKWESPYEPGRRGFSWVKFKEEEGKTGKLTDTIDAVVMGYYRGEGKRAGFGIGAILVGVRKGDSFVTITKVGTGVSDELWKELRVQLNKLKINIKPKQYANIDNIFMPDVWVNPYIVVEIAGDNLTKSPTHGAGVAIRFPRLVGIRPDKSPSDATSVAEVSRMYKNQSS